MPELVSDVTHPPEPARPRRARRYLTGLSAAGVTAALALTVAASGALASPAPSAHARVVTLTSSSSAPSGHLTVKVNYQLEPRGRKKVLSVTFSGGSKIKLRHAALIVSVRPALLAGAVVIHRRGCPPKSGTQQPCPIRVIAFTIILKIHSPGKFSGALQAKALAQISKVFARSPRVGPGGYLLSATVASVIRHKRQIAITAVPAALQVGVLLGPALP